MAWLELIIQIKRIHVELVSDFLQQANALSITWKAADQSQVFELDENTIPLWSHIEVIALFTENTSLPEVKTALQNKLGKEVILCFSYRTVADRCWERVWLDDWRPMYFGQRLCICPTHMDPDESSRVVVRLDPGLAFGTGTHSSTALCLEWLDAHVKCGQSVIDYGCGSGILAIASLKCGARSVVAVDHDPQAIEATCANVLQNAILPKQINCLLPEQLDPNLQVGIVISNILAKPLINLATRFRQHLKKQGGLCVLSGILDEQVESIQHHYTQQGFQCVNTHYKNEWARVVFALSNHYCS